MVDLNNQIKELIKMDMEIYELAKKSIEIVRPCQQCGWCCQNKRILVTIPEIIRILKHTGKDFSDIFVIEKNKLSISIKTKKINGKPYCIFYENGKCSIHDIKPFQCMTYPTIFNPLASLTGVVKEILKDKVIFECQAPHDKKSVHSVSIEDIDEITTKRVAFLTKSYSIQRKLIAQRRLKIIVKEMISHERA